MSAISAKILVMGIVQVLVLGLLLFIAAGTLSWFYSWVFLILFYSFSFGIVLWLLRHHYALNLIPSKGGSSDESQF